MKHMLWAAVLFCGVSFSVGQKQTTSQEKLLQLLRDHDTPVKNQKEIFTSEITDKLRRIFKFAHPYKGLIMEQLLKPGPIKQTVVDTKYSKQILQKLTQQKQDIRQLIDYYKRNTMRRQMDTSYSQGNCTRDYNDFAENIVLSFLGGIINDEIGFPVVGEPELTERSFALFDAMGKIPTGILEGKGYWIGSYEYCEDMKFNYTYEDDDDLIVEYEHREYGGRYCRIELQPALIPIYKYSVQNTYKYRDLYNYQFVNRYRKFDLPENESLIIGLSFGACVPDTCNRQNLTHELQENIFVLAILAVLDLRIDDVFCGVEGEFSDDRAAQAIVYFTLCIAGLLAIGTVFDILKRLNVKKPSKEGQFSLDAKSSKVYSQDPKTESSSSLPVRLILAFSMLKALEHVVDTKRGSDDLSAIRGVRVLSYAWLLLGHTHMLGVILAESFTTANLVTALPDLIESWQFQSVLNFHYSCDSFYVCSGLLVSYWCLKVASNNGGNIKPSQIVYFVFHKYVRWMLPYLPMVAVYFATYKYMSEGPLFPSQVYDADINCRKNWWINFLAINDMHRADDPCFLPTWYLASVFKFSIFGLLVMVIYLKLKVLGWLLILGSIGGNIAATAVLSNRYQNVINLDDIEETGGQALSWYRDLIVSPWARCGTFMIGMILGIVLYHYRQRRTPLKLNLCIRVIVLLVCLGLTSVVVYATYDQYREGGQLWSHARVVAYETLGRLALGTGVAGILFLCLTGNGGIVNRILSWKAWYPLDRLSYMAYIVNSLVCFLFVYSQQTLIYIDEYFITYLFLGNFMFSMLGALGFSMLYQWPVYFLEDALVPVQIKSFSASSHDKETESKERNAYENLVFSK